MKQVAKVSWKSPSNIAFIKYWGKHGIQLPNNPSVSLTLDKSHTITTVTIFEKAENKNIDVAFTFEGKPNSKFLKRIKEYLEKIESSLSFLRNYRIKIESKNSFPHSTGIASSASAMSALALCLGTIEQRLGNKMKTEFYRFVSELSRLGSGSAARSVFSEFAVWGETREVAGSSDNYAVKLNAGIHSDFKCLRDVILIVDEEEKKVSSSVGHSLMNRHPYAEARIDSAKNNMTSLLHSMATGDFERFSQVIENEALSLHAMMMTANPWYTLLSPATISIIEKIKQYRDNNKTKLTFTLDAGPNIHLIFPAEEEKKLELFIKKELVQHCYMGKYIVDNIGTGPELLIDEFK